MSVKLPDGLLAVINRLETRLNKTYANAVKQPNGSNRVFTLLYHVDLCVDEPKPPKTKQTGVTVSYVLMRKVQRTDAKTGERVMRLVCADKKERFPLETAAELISAHVIMRGHRVNKEAFLELWNRYIAKEKI
jgi:hypothetical protein